VRRTAFICAFFVTLAVPAAGLAMRAAPGDGTLVVRNGNAPRGTAVVTLVIRGAAIGQVSGYSKVVIQDLTPDNGAPAEVTGYGWHKVVVTDKATGDTADVWGGTDTVRFRAVGDVYKITIYGSDVDLVASGSGNATLTGLADDPTHDGSYSLNREAFHSLPAAATRLAVALPIPVTATG
jgi:hypothetical protein